MTLRTWGFRSKAALVFTSAFVLFGSTGCGDETTSTGGPGGGGPPEPMCGDAIPDPDLGEECDDGNLDDSDECRNDCTRASCGDGLVRPGIEDCDDGNQDDSDGCLSTCVAASCGDGVLYVGVEDCDDGNEEDGDACSSSCVAGTGCGNGVVEPGEDCDDGNTSNADACTNTCEDAVCGDGFAQVGVEDCDDGNSNDGDTCSNACTVNEPTTTTCPGTAISVGAANDVTVGGNTSTSADSYDSQGACAAGAGSGASEVVYQLDVQQTGLLTLELAAIGSDYDPVLYVRQSCEAGPTIACSDQTFLGGTESLSFAVTAGSTYYVFADGWESTAGDYLLAATLFTQVPGDDCPGVNVPVLDVGDSTSTSSDTSIAEANRAGTGLCDSPMTPEVIYKVTPSVASRLVVTIDPSPTFDASLYVRTSCTSASTQLACSESGDPGGVETATIGATAGQTYYIFVDGWDTSSGAFDATFELLAP
jgi:cysteine-rich repeat protein